MVVLSHKEKRSLDVRRLFEQKKIRMIAPTAHINTLKRNARTYINLRENKRQILTRFSRQWVKPNARHSEFECFCRSFFLILKERKRITVIFFIIALFTMFFFWFSSFVNCILLFLKTISYLGTSLDI
jgi:hypothetical protein